MQGLDGGPRGVLVRAGLGLATCVLAVAAVVVATEGGTFPGGPGPTVTLAPTSRMVNRGALASMLNVGKNVSAYGYPSTVQPDEMRAERITVNGKTVELR